MVTGIPGTDRHSPLPLILVVRRCKGPALPAPVVGAGPADEPPKSRLNTPICRLFSRKGPVDPADLLDKATTDRML
jgi:hypothetical protein